MMDSKKIVLVTDCSSGIGSATAALLAGDEGYKVYVIAKSTSMAEGLSKISRTKLNNSMLVKQADLREDAEVSKIVDDIVTCEGKIDLLVIDTGTGISGPIESIPLNKIEDLFDTNVYGVIRLIKDVLPGMKSRQSGHIVLISSVDGILGIPYKSIACASKFAIEGMAEALSAEVHQFNIRISLVEPGPVLDSNTLSKEIHTDISKDPLDNLTDSLYRLCQEKQEGIYKTMGQKPEDIAHEIVNAITSPHAHFRYITNKLYSSAVSDKLSDSSGDTVVSSIRENFTL